MTTSTARDHERPLLMVGAVLAAVGLGRAVQFGNGAFTPEAITWLFGVCATLIIAWLLPPNVHLTPRLGSAVAVVGAMALVYQFSILSSYPPGVYLQVRVADPWRTFQEGVGMAAVIAGLGFAKDKWVRGLALVGLVGVYLMLGNWLIFTSPQPTIDVWHIHRESVTELLKGINPYTLTFKNIYQDGRYFGPGMVENGRLMFGYTYPPLSLLLAIPGQLWGDYRFSLLVCNSVTALLMAFARPSRFGAMAAALFLFTPRSFFVLEQGWTEPVLLLCVALVGFMAIRFPKALPIVAGLMLASKQYAVLLGPALLLLPEATRDRKTFIAFAWKTVAVAALFTVPFFLWGPKAFLHSVFEVQFGLPFRTDSLNVSAWWVQRGNEQPPGILGWLMLIPAYALLWWRAPRTAGGFALGAGTVLMFFVVLNRQAFCNYYFMIIGSLLVGAAFSFPADDSAGATREA